jgi:hypothetical protein
MAELTYEERNRLRRLAEDARDACNRHYGPFVDAVAHPLNILALLDMVTRAEQQRDGFAAAMLRALSELSNKVDEHHKSLPAEAASALSNAIKALQRALA